MLFQNLKRIVAVAAILCLSACASVQKQSANDLYESSVKVTNTAGNHGGTGIVLRSSPTVSYVLTNSHVCGVVEKGGKVSGVNGTFMVTGYKRSTHHDLCLIKVAGNLGANTVVAKRPPVLQRERVAISGHPHLMPNVISRGQYSGSMIVQILVDIKECTEDDMKDENKAVLCFFLGGIPVVKEYQATVVSATIQPGNSGSGVYNSQGELSGVAFAGAGDFGYALVVPYEDMMQFLTKEIRQIPFTTPSNEVDLFGDRGKSRQATFFKNLEKACAEPMLKMQLGGVCSLQDNDLIQ